LNVLIVCFSPFYNEGLQATFNIFLISQALNAGMISYNANVYSYN